MQSLVPNAPHNPRTASMTFSQYGDRKSMYGGSFYGQPALDHRASNYSLSAAAQASPAPGLPVMPPQNRQSSSYFPPQGQQPGTNYLSDLSLPQDSSLGELSGEAVTDERLENSIRSICIGADLETLTKKGVRKQLEAEYGVGLGSRKDGINRLIEKVLSGES